MAVRSRDDGGSRIGACADCVSTATSPPASLQVERATGGGRDLLVVQAATTWRAGGWKHCLANPKMIAALGRIKSYLDYGVFQPIRSPSIVALRECEADTKRICAVYQKRRDVLIEGLARAGWKSSLRGTMFVWAPLPNATGKWVSLEFSKLLLEKALVAVSAGVGFGPMGEGLTCASRWSRTSTGRARPTRTIKQFLGRSS